MEQPCSLSIKYGCKRAIIGWVICFVFFIPLTACTSTSGPVPIVDAWHQTHKVHGMGMHRVQPGETLHTIALRYNWDSRKLAELNHLKPPYKILVGSYLQVQHANSSTRLVHKTSKSCAVTTTKTVAATSSASSRTGTWLWPVQGKVITPFARSGINKGIDIATHANAPVVATAAGKVVYSGSGLRGYGKLIIIKHNDEFLSAYAHNNQLLVHEGDTVTAGQKIAEAGDTDAKRIMLHFEIRRAGKPVDPMQYLK